MLGLIIYSNLNESYDDYQISVIQPNIKLADSRDYSKRFQLLDDLINSSIACVYSENLANVFCTLSLISGTLSFGFTVIDFMKFDNGNEPYNTRGKFPTPDELKQRLRVGGFGDELSFFLEPHKIPVGVQPLRYYQGVKDRTMQMEYYSTRLTFGVKYDLF